MIVLTDTGPLNYLILIGAADVSGVTILLPGWMPCRTTCLCRIWKCLTLANVPPLVSPFHFAQNGCLLTKPTDALKRKSGT
jgi:hypothetical protein